jgi:hypothetical protein
MLVHPTACLRCDPDRKRLRVCDIVLGVWLVRDAHRSHSAGNSAMDASGRFTRSTERDATFIHYVRIIDEA